MLQGGIVNFKKNKKPDGTLKIGALCHGAQVSIDHFESRLLGQSFNYYGGSAADKIVGGCSFVDHDSDFLHVEHQVGFSSVETIRSKQNYESRCMEQGNVVHNYLTIATNQARSSS